MVNAPGLFAGALSALLSLSNAAQAGLGAGAEPNWEPWVEVGAFASDGNDRAEFVGWVPVAQREDALLFIEARGKFFDGGNEEGNFALGYRNMRSDGWNLGVWGGVDVRTSDHGNSFTQIAGGVEALSTNWDVRLNGYLPLEDREAVGLASSSSSTSSTATGPNLNLVGSQLFFVRGGSQTTTVSTTTQGYDLAAWGVDGEVGRRVPLEDWLNWVSPINESGDFFDNEARIFLGAFYFDNALFADAIWGPRMRSEWRLNDVIEMLPGSRLTLEAEAQYDDVREEQFEIGLRLRIPLEAPDNYSQHLSAQSIRMTEALERDTDIVTSNRSGITTVSVTSVDLPTTLEPVKDPRTNVNLNNVVFLTSPSGAQAAITAAGAETLLAFDGSAGDFGQIVLSDSQSVVGGGAGLLVEGRTTGVQDTYVGPGTAATLHLEAEADVLRVGNNTHVTGLTIESNNGASTDGIYVPGSTTNVYIDNNVLQNLGGRGLEVDAGSQFIFASNRISNVAFSSADIGANTTAVFTDNVWIDIGHSVLNLRNDVTLTFTGNDLQGTSATGGVTPAIFRFSGSAGPVTVLDGSGNTDNLVNSPPVCITSGAASFTGTITFGAVVLTDNILPCN